MSSIQDRVEKYDQSNYLDLLENFADQVRDGVSKGRNVSVDSDYNKILVCGMGGSGIAGDLLSQFLFYKSPVPIVSNRFYRVPAWVDSDTLVIVVSYSGNTEETLSACDDALRCDAKCVAVTSDGKLQNQADEENLTRIEVPEDLPPRAAAAYLFLPLPFVLAEGSNFEAPGKKIVDRTCSHLNDMVSELSPDQPDNRAYEIAQNLMGKLPLVYGSEEITSVLARRFKNQINENAKLFSVYNVLPEMNHNEIMALDHLEANPERYGVIFLRDDGEHARVQKRFEILEDLLDGSVGSLSEIRSRGRSLLARFLTVMLFTDYVSYYLALLNEKDPTSIGYINELKERL